jgi:hypothetical protein
MNVVLSATLQTRDPQAKSHHLAAVERPENLSADFIRHYEQSLRQQFNIVKAPNLALQLNHGRKFIELGELVNFNHLLSVY